MLSLRQMMPLYRISECHHILVTAFYGYSGPLCRLSWSARGFMLCHAVSLSVALIVLRRRRRHLNHRLSCAVSLENTSQGIIVNPYPTAFPYGKGMVLHFYQQQKSSTTKTVHKVINKGLKTYV